MTRYLVALWLIALASPLARQDDVQATLGRAETLYYEAKFRDSIDLLLPLDSRLQSQSERVADRVSVKLALALAYIGLNDNPKAKFNFTELCALDTNCSLDPQRFSPKVIAIFEEARVQHTEVYCRTICEKASKELDGGNLAKLNEFAASSGAKCGCLSAVLLDAADFAHQQGLEAYKRDDLSDALEKFRAALKFNSKHEFASQYLDLTQSKLKLLVDQRALDWRRSFDAAEYSSAATSYRQLALLGGEASVALALEQMKVEYRKALPSVVENWTRSCAAGDRAMMDVAHSRAVMMLPDPAIAADILEKMTICNVPPPAPVQACVEMASQLAMVRVKTRVNPDIPPALQSVLRNPLARTVQVTVTIDKEGDVEILQTQGENAAVVGAVRTAVEKWKFHPAIIQDQVRCVRTVLPITIAL